MEMLEAVDPYTRPTYSLSNRVARFVWEIVQRTAFRWSPRSWHGWRSWLLRRFGARVGEHCHVYPKARVWAPWNLTCEDTVAIGDEAIVYNPAQVFLRSHAIISFQAYLCGADHDLSRPGFPVVMAPIVVGRYGWVCARAIVRMGVTMGDGAVLGLGAVASKDLEPWSIYVGVPARRVSARDKFPVHEQGSRRPMQAVG